MTFNNKVSVETIQLPFEKRAKVKIAGKYYDTNTDELHLEWDLDSREILPEAIGEFYNL